MMVDGVTEVINRSLSNPLHADALKIAKGRAQDGS